MGNTTKRTGEQLKKCWNNIKFKSRQQKMVERKETMATGGGPSRKDDEEDNYLRKTLESANCMLDNLSSEDSSHSELHSGDPLAFIDMASSSLDKGCKSGPSSITFDLPESTVSKNVVLATLSTKNSGTQLPQEPDFPEGTLSTIPTMSNHHSSHSPQQRTPLNKRPNVEIENIQFNFDDTSLETSQIDASLKRLEDISNKVNHESILNDNFDDFGRYVVSLLRSIPAQRAKELQQEIIDLILKSDSNPSVSLDMLRQESSTLPDKESQKRTSPMNVDSPIAQATSASSSESSVPSTSTQAVEMPVLASSRLTPQDSSLIAQKVSVNEPMLQQNSKGDKRPPPSVDTASTTQNVKLSLHGQNERRNKRPLADGDISCEVTNKQSKLDNMLLKANRLDAALKRLEELVLVSNKVTLLSGKNDHFDIFGTYVSSLLKYFPLQKGMELQRQIINLILRVHVDVDT
ncbi:hypothetical protein C0J52_23827 [Blattella germanica]|nr:hypothetical protein C0J52_23827 [Blattella germanica]